MSADADRHPVPDFTLVIPTFNERQRLDVLLQRIFDACRPDGIAVEIVIVDDNSPDGTGLLADEWASRRPVRVIHRAGKLGLGSAVLEGFSVARAQIVGVMDADLSHPPELLPLLFATISGGGFDIVVGSRYVSGGGTTGWPLGRQILSRLACTLARPLTPVRDAVSGFFLIRRERLERFQTSVSGFKIGLELIVRSHPRWIAEVGYLFVERAVGESKLTWSECVGFLSQLTRLYAVALRASMRRPACVTIPVAADLARRRAPVSTSQIAP